MVFNWLLLRLRGRFFPIDSPNHRSLHTGEIPRTGGGAVLLSVLLFVVLNRELRGGVYFVMVLPGLMILAVVSFWDDVKELSALPRLGVQVMVASIYLLGVGWTFDHELDVLIALVICIVWSINLYNFMDGMDGLAGTMAVIGFGTFSLIGYLAGESFFAGFMAVIVCSTAGFLVFNLPPARIFMGDVGSTFLGYIMATASLWGIDRGIFPFWVPLLVFLPFWLDATLTLLRRLARGERVWEAHCSHFYQRAVLSGMTVRKVLFIEVVFMLTCAILAISGWFLWVSGR